MKNYLAFVLFLVIFLSYYNKSEAQGIRVDTSGVAVNFDDSSPDASAILDVKSTSKGLLVPRLTTAQRSGITSPATSLLVFDTDLEQFFYYTGSAWKVVSSKLDAGKLFVGNAGGFASARTMSGDATIDSLGVITIASNAITTTKIANNAVDGTKIAMGSDANGDIIYYNGTDYIRLAIGSSGTFLKSNDTIPSWGTALSSLGGLTGTTQTFAAGTTGTDFGISSAGTTHTFNIPVASATNTGKLSSTDWSTFNNKLSTAVTSLGGLTGTTQTFATGTTGTDFGISSVGTTHTFNIPVASGTNTGKLSSTDWTTFNNKLGTSLTSAKIWVGNVSNIATAVTMSGDATLSNAGALTIGSNAITNTKIADNAVTGAKIDLTSNATGDLMWYNGTDWARLAAGTTGRLLKANGAATPTWLLAAGGVNISNDSILLGGTLSKNTTITQGSNSFTLLNNGTANTTFNLSSTGDFDIQDNGTTKFFVSDAGKIGIGTNAPTSTFCIGGAGSSSINANIISTLNANGSKGLYVEGVAPTSGWSYGIYGYISNSGSNSCVGVYGNAIRSSATSSGRSYGLYGYAGNCTNGYNYSVYGYLGGSNDGAAVYGTTSGDVGISGKWAGYFNGDVYISSKLGVNTTSPAYKIDVPNDTVRFKAVLYTSDQRLKDNILPVQGSMVNKLYQLSAKTYNLKPLPGTMPLMNISDTSVVTAPLLPSNTYLNKKSIGFIAQEVQQIFPEIVSVDKNGYYSLDYISLIPVIVESVKEQKTLIDTQSQTIIDLNTQIQTLTTKNNELEQRLLELETKLNNHLQN